MPWTMGFPRTQDIAPCSLHAVRAIAFPRLFIRRQPVWQADCDAIFGRHWIARGRDMLMCPKRAMSCRRYRALYPIVILARDEETTMLRALSQRVRASRCASGATGRSVVGQARSCPITNGPNDL